MDSDFLAASERAEHWFAGFSGIAACASRGDIEGVYCFLHASAIDYDKHYPALNAALDRLVVLSDGPIEWAAGRGLSGMHPGPGILPHVWSSAHQMALELLLLSLIEFETLRDFKKFDKQQLKNAQRWVKDKGQALAIPLDEMARLQERMRRERTKYLEKENSPHQEVVWEGDDLNGKLIIDGIPAKLAAQESQVLGALIKHGAADKPTLEKMSGVSDAVAVLNKTVRKFPVLKPHIIFPGVRGKGGYRTTIRQALSK